MFVLELNCSIMVIKLTLWLIRKSIILEQTTGRRWQFAIKHCQKYCVHFCGPICALLFIYFINYKGDEYRFS